jgi:hypothetical protein
MARIGMTRDEIRTVLFELPALQGQESARHQIADMILRLSEADDWFPDPLRRGLHALQSSGLISEFDRHAVEKAFFPEHQWG